jgi:hypothetical protein
MNRLRSLLQTGVALLSCMAITGVAWAEKSSAKEPDAGPKDGWTVTYLLLILAVALGLVVVLRPGTRGKKLVDRSDGD